MTTTVRIIRGMRAGAVLLVAFAVAGVSTAGCFGGGGVDRPSGPDVEQRGTGPEHRIMLFTAANEKIRTRKLLTVTEILPRGDQATSSIDESYVQTTVSVDTAGQPVHAIRRWERFQTRVERPGAEPVEETGALEGSEVELIQRVSGVTARVVSGSAGQGQLSGMLLSGMEPSLLPAGPVRVGDRWLGRAGESGEFAGVFRALGLTPSRSEQRCALVAVDTAVDDDGNATQTARISIDWQVTGTLSNSGPGTPIVMRLSGEMAVDLGAGLVTRLELSGGRQLEDGGIRRQLAIRIEREAVRGWYD